MQVTSSVWHRSSWWAAFCFWCCAAFSSLAVLGSTDIIAGNAIKEIAALPISYAGHQVCESCHADILEVKSKGVHKGVACESCHGPLAKHADDPASVQPAKLDTAVLCVRCHEANLAKPKNFPQVVSAEHSGGAPCDTCHQPHSPAIVAVAGGSQ